MEKHQYRGSEVRAACRSGSCGKLVLEVGALRWIAFLALVCVLGLAGCGGTEADRRSSETGTDRALAVASLARSGAGTIAKSYACSDNEVWFPVKWSRVPHETQETAIYVSLSRRVEARDATTRFVVVARWLIFGLRPERRELRTGRLPAGARIISIPKRNPCPHPMGKGLSVFARVFALSDDQSIGEGPFSVSTLTRPFRGALATGDVGATVGSGR